MAAVVGGGGFTTLTGDCWGNLGKDSLFLCFEFGGSGRVEKEMGGRVKRTLMEHWLDLNSDGTPRKTKRQKTLQQN